MFKKDVLDAPYTEVQLCHGLATLVRVQYPATLGLGGMLSQEIITLFTFHHIKDFDLLMVEEKLNVFVKEKPDDITKENHGRRLNNAGKARLGGGNKTVVLLLLVRTLFAFKEYCIACVTKLPGLLAATPLK
jgi:hypothetical protein